MKGRTCLLDPVEMDLLTVRRDAYRHRRPTCLEMLYDLIGLKKLEERLWSREQSPLAGYVIPALGSGVDLGGALCVRVSFLVATIQLLLTIGPKS